MRILSYAELDAQADEVAALLRSKGARPGSLIALYMTKSCRLFVGLLGILKAGAGYVPLDTKFPVGRILAILEDAEAKIVLSDDKTAKSLPSHLDIVNLDVPLASAAVGLPAAEPPTSNDICYVIYTSGSTGKPKGVVIEHRNAVNFVEALHKVYQLDQNDRIYQGFSLAFDASVEEILGRFLARWHSRGSSRGRCPFHL